MSFQARLIAVSFIVLFGACTQSSVQEPPQGLQCHTVPLLMAASLQYHFSKHALSPELQTRTIKMFIKSMDPSKQLFLKPDIDSISTSLNSVFRSMTRGDCTAVTAAWRTLLSRAQETFDIASKELAVTLTLDKDARYQVDPEKREFAQDLRAKRDLIHSAIQVEMATMTAGGLDPSKARKQLLKRYELSMKRIKEMSQDKILTLFLESFARSLDPHSEYMSAEKMADFNNAMRLSFEGIGATLGSEDGYIVVKEITKGGSADRARTLLPKDKIISVAQETGEAINISDMPVSEVVKLIRGKSGTKVKLTVMRQKGDQSDSFSVTLVRDKVSLEEQAAKMVYETVTTGNKRSKIAIIELPSFYGAGSANEHDSYVDLKKLVDEAASQKVDGMILDLSQNGGGLLENVVQIAGLFIKTGSVVAIEDEKKNRHLLIDEDPQLAYSGPLMILTSRLSASASEILAGAMQDYRRALIVGSDRTYGKGSVQNILELPEGLGLFKVTTRLFFLPDGESTQYAGVSADVPLPSIFDSDDLGEKTLDYPLATAKTNAFISTGTARATDPKHSWNPIDAKLIDYLTARSAERIKNSEEFKKIKADNEEDKKNQGWVSVADILNRTEKEKEKRKAQEEEASTMKGRQALWIKNPRMQESLKIFEDWLGHSMVAQNTQSNMRSKQRSAN